MDNVEEREPHLPNMNYETDLSTRDFIYFVQDYSQFLREYINNRYRDDPEEVGYLSSFIDISNGINADTSEEEEYYERYRESLQPFMEWITLWAEDMNNFYENEFFANRPQEPIIEEVARGIAGRTRSKRPFAGKFEIPPPKRGTNIIRWEPTTQEGVRITLSDGKSYTYNEIKDMWRFSKVQTPYRHAYTQDDIQKIKDLIEFATEGGKRKRTRTRTRKIKKSRKTKKLKNKKVRKTKSKRRVK